MTNAEKFKEVFGPRWVDWEAEYKGTPTIPLSVIEDIKAEIEELGIWHEKLLIETIDIKRVLEIIDKVVKECTHE